MRGHGATVAGTTLQEAVFRSISGCMNAEYQFRAMAIGKLIALTEAETRDAGAYNLRPRPMARAYEYWTLRLGDRADFPSRRKAAAKAVAAPDRQKKQR